MICDMKRVAGLVTLLGLASTAASRPALAQDATGNSWFDGAQPAAAPAEGAPAEGADQGTPPPPPDTAPPEAGESGPDDSALMDPNQPPSAPPMQAAGSAPPGPDQGPSQDNTPETDPRAMTEFRSTLDPYGNWVEDQKYGTVWVPNREAVGDDFAPYVSAGHWALSDDNDWVWQSDYPFGDVVFHYGRWVWIPGTGWSWVAGRRYANAWVTWRVPTDDYGYVGWAPMPPAWGWYGGSAVSLWWAPPAAYVFCPSLYAFSPRVHSYIVHDQYVIHDVAAHTRNFSGGRGGGVQRVAASPRILPANSAPPHGPSLQSVHVPASVTPASRVTFAGVRAGGGGASFRSSEAYSGTSSVRPRTAYQPSQYQGARSWSQSTYRASAYGNGSVAPRSAYAAPTTNYRAAPRTWSAPNAPRYYPAPSASLSAPTQRSSAPAYHYAAPAQHYSAPAYHYSAPAQHYSAPVYHYSAPTPHYSAPSFNSAPSFHSAPAFHFSSRR